MGREFLSFASALFYGFQVTMYQERTLSQTPRQVVDHREFSPAPPQRQGSKAAIRTEVAANLKCLAGESPGYFRNSKIVALLPMRYLLRFCGFFDLL